MTDKTVKFGLIGFGAWGGCHANAINVTDGAEIVAIAVRSEESQSKAREAYPDAQVYGDYKELLANDEIEAVDIVVPSFLHHEVAKAALEAGKHLLLEKPMTLSVADCRELVEIAQSQNVNLAIGHELRLSSLWARAKEMIDEGLIGDPQYVLVELSRRPYRPGASGWRFDLDRVGNWILEEPIHFFDLARWYLSFAGEPESIYAKANSRDPEHPELQDNFSAIMNWSGGQYAVVTQTLSAFEHHQTAKITGTKGAIWASWSGAMDRTRHPTFFLKAFDGEEVRELKLERSAGELFELEDQIAMLVNAIRNGGPIACPGEDGMWSVAMCLAAQKSVDENRAVKMDEVV
ncbi:MAG: Gfo/Idh/MocA family oxidoreductase [Planctomycetaceae bacterium]|nr:Gfo/Idh/MocA family oxidoreductase [Planctomycetaceae bacterium]MDG2388328.1 Gfo/Idh/MocA family oxidoreductase [Planctomycetaceae bacterium]